MVCNQARDGVSRNQARHPNGDADPDESAQRLEDWPMVLLGIIHHAFQRIDAAEPGRHLING